MEGMTLFGAVVAVAWLLQTLVSAFFASKSKRGEAAWRWRRKMEPVHLDALDWIYQVQQWAAIRGMKDQLPSLPQSLQGYHPVGEDWQAEDWDTLNNRWKNRG